MAKLTDYVDESGNPKTPEPKTEKAETKVEQEALPSTEAPEPEDELPEQYKGKSLKEVVEMHQNAVSLAGKHGDKLQHQDQKITELQQAIDTLILAQPVKEEEEVDYFSDPEAAITKAIENNPRLKEISEKLEKTEAKSEVSQLTAKHPDVAEVTRSEKFLEWVQEESGRRLLYEAAQSGNLAAADSVLSDFKKTQKPKAETKDKRKSETQRASTGVTSGSTAASSRKVYKRRDIIELMKSEPRKYQSMMKEIRLAYEQGRVTD